MRTNPKITIIAKAGAQCLIALFFSLLCTSTIAQVKVYPAPKEQPISADYIIEVNGKTVPVYPVVTQHHDKKYAIAYFDFTGTVNVKIKTQLPLESLNILPERHQVKFKAEKGEINFTLDKPIDISIEPTGQNSPLLLFCNPPENDAPKPSDKNVVYFGPGMHNPKGGLIKLTSGQTLYLAGGAVVKAGIDATGDNIKIMGRGILDGSDWVHNAGPNDFFLNLTDCNNLVIKDIILKGSYYWTVVPQRCDRVLIDHIRLAGSRVGNDDGIDPCNSSNVTIRNCFLRTDDDAISPKGTTRADGIANSRPCENILVENCTFWVDYANVFRIATESSCPGLRNFTARNIDVIHMPERPSVSIFYLHPTGQMPMENLTFEDIRINGEGKVNIAKITPMQPLVGTRPVEVPKPNNITDGPGRRGVGSRGYGEFVVIPAAGPYIHNVTFKNISISGKAAPAGTLLISGVDEQKNVKNITFTDLTRYGQPVTVNSEGVKIGNFATDIDFLKKP
jgi:hypothetical protein